MVSFVCMMLFLSFHAPASSMTHPWKAHFSLVSRVHGSRGSADTIRDVGGFAIKFILVQPAGIWLERTFRYSLFSMPSSSPMEFMPSNLNRRPKFRRDNLYTTISMGLYQLSSRNRSYHHVNYERSVPQRTLLPNPFSFFEICLWFFSLLSFSESIYSFRLMPTLQRHPSKLPNDTSFGLNTFCVMNEKRKRVFVKFHDS
jgi:hypothetical protein